jgi:hypothetical protein
MAINKNKEWDGERCRPITTKHTTGTLGGGPAAAYGTQEDVLDLPITRIPEHRLIVSVWQFKWWERVKLLFHGKITLSVHTETTHPPISLTPGDWIQGCINAAEKKERTKEHGVRRCAHCGRKLGRDQTRTCEHCEDCGISAAV